MPLKRPGLRVIRPGRAARGGQPRPEARTEATEFSAAEPAAAAEPPAAGPDEAAQPPAEDFFSRGLPPALLPPDPDSSDLAREPVPHLLWRLSVQGVAGKMVFRSGSDEKAVFFEAGVPVGVRSNQTADRLEELLFRQGLIDRAAYAEARVKGLEQARPLAAHLVERGLLRPDELFPLVRRHLETCLLGLFEWSSGEAHYEAELALDADKVRLARPLPSLLMEGIRRKFLLPRMMEQLGGPASLLAPVPAEQREPACDPEALELTAAEREVLRLVDGMRPIEEIVFLSGREVSTVYRVLLAANVVGLVRVAVRGLRADAENPEQSEQRDLEIRRRRLEAKFAQIHEASYFDILGVGEKANPYEIQAAHDELAREFHPLHYAHPALAELKPKLEIVQRTLAEARDVLSDDLLRAGYREALQRGD